MDVEVNAQFTGSVRNRLPTGLSQSHRLPLKLGCVDLLHLLHDPFPPSGRVYSKISLLHKFGGRSDASTRDRALSGRASSSITEPGHHQAPSAAAHRSQL